ncbi:YbjQ family protein [Geodermatophilus sp. CPCC 206100]|uniref:YbjQ family protein n=1 Tax=Geodermatophilus sp. CPCC 206100 TaxID=3020054 RepID=UPI003B009648
MVPVLITTTNEVPGYRVEAVFGEVFGLTVRSRHAGSQLGAAMKSLAGGELKGLTKNLEESRQEAIERLVSAAEAKGADAVVAMRFDTTEMGSTWTEVCAYGTACRLTRV